MSRPPKSSRVTSTDAEARHAALLAFFAGAACDWLAHPNVVGVMFGRKTVAGAATDQEAIVFRVDRKLGDRAEILMVGSKPIPAEIEVAGRLYPTDIIEGAHSAAGSDGVTATAAIDPRRRFDRICPGVSVGNAAVAGDAGTGTAIVRDRATGQLALLSSDHVLGRRDGTRDASQPGRADGGGANDRFGTLIRQMRGLHGDAAIAAITRRPADPRVAGLGVVIDRIALPRFGDIVVKAGRTTGISWGRVSAEMGTMRINYLESATIEVVGFEIEPLDNQPTQRGDSGAPWLLADPATRQPTGTLVGIHTSKTPSGGRSFACFATKVFEQLEIDLAAANALEAREPASGIRSGGATPMRVTARNGLVLRGGAGVDFPRLDVLQFQSTVTRVGTLGEWSKVDVEGDGAVDGFVYSEFLETLQARG